MEIVYAKKIKVSKLLVFNYKICASTCKCFWTRRMFIYVLWFTFKIIVRYFVCITTAKAFRVRRHKQGKEYYNYLISWCCFFDMNDAHGVIQHAGCL